MTSIAYSDGHLSAPVRWLLLPQQSLIEALQSMAGACKNPRRMHQRRQQKSGAHAPGAVTLNFALKLPVTSY
jgi:hypothetical protein